MHITAKRTNRIRDKMQKIDITDITEDIKRCRLEVRILQFATIECVSFKPTGKIEIVDEGKLTTLNDAIDMLKACAEHNEKVLSDLKGCLARVDMQSLSELERAKNAAQEAISSCKIGINKIAADVLRQSPTYSLENIKTHPKVKPEVESRESRIVEMEARLKILTPALDEVRTIAAEFQPSGLEPKPSSASTAPAMISREKVSGFGV
jgi:hypothetical protein